MGRYKWERYYENIWEWTTSEAVSHIEDISSFGPSEEVMEVINEIAFDDTKGAVCLLKKATDSGVKFTGKQFADMDIDEKEDELKRAIRFSCDQFTDADLEAIEGYFEDEFVIEIAQLAKLKIPQAILEAYNEEFSDHNEFEDDEMSQVELLDLYNHVLSCLYDAHEYLKKALSLSIGDLRSKQKSLSIAKHWSISQAEALINEVQLTLEEIEVYTKNPINVRNLRLNMGKWIVFHDVLGDGLITDLMVQRRIQNMIKGIEKIYAEVQVLKKLQ